jgi:hypothetical protein
MRGALAHVCIGPKADICIVPAFFSKSLETRFAEAVKIVLHRIWSER